MNEERYAISDRSPFRTRQFGRVIAQTKTRWVIEVQDPTKIYVIQAMKTSGKEVGGRRIWRVVDKATYDVARIREAEREAERLIVEQHRHDEHLSSLEAAKSANPDLLKDVHHFGILNMVHFVDGKGNAATVVWTITPVPDPLDTDRIVIWIASVADDKPGGGLHHDSVFWEGR